MDFSDCAEGDRFTAWGRKDDPDRREGETREFARGAAADYCGIALVVRRRRHCNLREEREDG